ncbi:MAG: signal peptidase I [Oscillospiraceae bacterium]
MKKFYETIESICISFIAITILILFVFRVVSVEGNSMNNTLMDSERLITTNFFYTPKKGDIVVIDKNNPHRKPLIKRVIATGGDNIKIEYTTGDVYLNGKLLEEKYIKEKIAPKKCDDLELTIPKGYVFVMGDNRNASSDSREEAIGAVNTKNIIGKAIFRIYPFSRIGSLK